MELLDLCTPGFPQAGVHAIVIAPPPTQLRYRAVVCACVVICLPPGLPTHTFRPPQDMNGIAARALAAMLLPSQPRRAGGSLPGAGGGPGGGGHTGRGSPGGGGPGAGAGGVSLPALRRSSSAGGRASGDGSGQGPYG